MSQPFCTSVVDNGGGEWAVKYSENIAPNPDLPGIDATAFHFRTAGGVNRTGTAVADLSDNVLTITTGAGEPGWVSVDDAGTCLDPSSVISQGTGERAFGFVNQGVGVPPSGPTAIFAQWNPAASVLEVTFSESITPTSTGPTPGLSFTDALGTTWVGVDLDPTPGETIQFLMAEGGTPTTAGATEGTDVGGNLVATAGGAPVQDWTGVWATPHLQSVTFNQAGPTATLHFDRNTIYDSLQEFWITAADTTQFGTDSVNAGDGTPNIQLLLTPGSTAGQPIPGHWLLNDQMFVGPQDDVNATQTGITAP